MMVCFHLAAYSNLLESTKLRQTQAELREEKLVTENLRHEVDELKNSLKQQSASTIARSSTPGKSSPIIMRHKRTAQISKENSLNSTNQPVQVVLSS